MLVRAAVSEMPSQASSGADGRRGDDGITRCPRLRGVLERCRPAQLEGTGRGQGGSCIRMETSADPTSRGRASYLSAGRRARSGSVGLVLATGIAVSVCITLLASVWAPSSHSVLWGSSTEGPPVRVQVSPGAAGVAAASGSSPLSLGTTVTPSEICGLGASTCDAGIAEARVTLTAQVTNNPRAAYPDVQVAFVVETTAQDGVYYHDNINYGLDPCAGALRGHGPLCEESNGVPFFIANAQGIASAISGSNSHANVTFAMVDFFGTDYDWNDGPRDSWKYHVAVPSFVPASQFGSAVRTGFQNAMLTEANGWGCECSLDDNFLHSSSITALYGAIIGSGLDWSPNTHHVLVLMGSTAPRAPGYEENYWVSAFDHCCASPSPFGSTCEPSFQFSNGSSPTCEGWVTSQDGNPGDSIAALTKQSPTCTDSIGHTCTIDVVDYWDTPTDPYSRGWPANPGFPSGSSGAGPGGAAVLTDSAHILESGCDLAAATGGTWAGPAFWTCPNGASGTLQYVPHGSQTAPNTANPTLLAALRQIGFGPVYQSMVASGTGRPIFSYVPPPNFRVAADPQFATACSIPTGFLRTCQQVPTVAYEGGLPYFGWNWSTNKTTNQIFVGDGWTASFNIVNTGPPYAVDPVLECTTEACGQAGAGEVGGVYSWAMFGVPNSTVVVAESFPLATVRVVSPTVEGPPPSQPPPPPPVQPGIPVVATPAPPVPAPTLSFPGPGFGTISLQATAAGFLGAGFMRVGLKNRPIAMKIAAKNGRRMSSKFESTRSRDLGPGIGRFE